MGMHLSLVFYAPQQGEIETLRSLQQEALGGLTHEHCLDADASRDRKQKGCQQHYATGTLLNY